MIKSFGHWRRLTNMTDDAQNYRRNHYVPIWYQKKFLLPGQSKMWRLDLSPATKSSVGHTWQTPNVSQKSPKASLFQDDLYTTNYFGMTNSDIEKYFFGSLDGRGKKAIEHFVNFKFGGGSHEAFNALLPYMSVQKLRTPKGLQTLRREMQTQNKNDLLHTMQQMQTIFCATWTECVWQIADATKSETKFILSDHPVVVYNREAFPASKYCESGRDPDIRLLGTHTYFPLSLDKVLILTNLAWVRDPYQSALSVRPNPTLFRKTMFNFMDIQVDRYLTNEEVIEINYITKMRAQRFVLASQKSWLFPEEKMTSDHWRKLGDGYLLMPEPRHIHGGGEKFIGYENGQSEHFNEYGHRPWQKGYKSKERHDREWQAMLRFKAEWTSMFGKDYRALVWRSPVRKSENTMSDEYYNRLLEMDKKNRTLAGERQRRRGLRRSH